MIDAATVEEYMRDANPIPAPENVDADEFAYFVATTRARRAAAMQAPTQHPSDTATPPAAPPPRRRNVWAFAVAFVLILIVVGGAALFLGGDAPQVTDELEPRFDVQSLEWTMTELGESLVDDVGADLVRVTTGGPGFVAVGRTDCHRTSGCNDDAAVWTSIDGTDWSRIPRDPEVFGGASGSRETDDVTSDGSRLVAVGHRTIEDVTSDGSRLVAVGGGLNEPDRPGEFAVVWVSEDGYEWSRVPLPGSGGTWLHSVTVGGPGFVAVGSDSGAAAVWNSPDGVNWDRVSHDPRVFGQGSALNAVTVGGPGLVAVGSDSGVAAIWTSPDGFAWSRVPHDEAVFRGVGFPVILDVVAGGPGLVAVGMAELHPNVAISGWHGAVWISTDGLTWTRIPHDPVLFGGGVNERQMRSVVAVSTGLVAVGSDVWTSADGITWTLTDGVGRSVPKAEWPPQWNVEWGEFSDITIGPKGLVAVGTSGGYEVDGTKQQAAVWTATVQD